MTIFWRRYNTENFDLEPSGANSPQNDESNVYLNIEDAKIDTSISPDSSAHFITQSSTMFDTIAQEYVSVNGNPASLIHGVSELTSEYDHLKRSDLESVLTMNDAEYSQIDQQQLGSFGRELDCGTEEYAFSSIDEPFNSSVYQLLESTTSDVES